MIVFCDMDGVLVDFDAGLKKYEVENCRDVLHLPKESWPPEKLEIHKSVVQTMRKPGFFRELPPMEGYKELWDYCGKFERKVLTARPEDSVSGKRVAQEKQDWLLWHLGEFNKEDFICCLRSEKQDYAKTTRLNLNKGKTWVPNGFSWHTDSRIWITVPNILIDDMESNCKAWIKAGGIAILFKNSKQVIEELERFVG